MKINLIRRILLYLFPKQCLYCDAFGWNICPDCERKYFIKRKRQICHVCKKEIELIDGEIINQLVHSGCRSNTNIAGALICVEYNKQVLKLIETIKYSLYFEYIEELIPFYIEIFRKYFSDTPKEQIIFVPVPIHRRREWERGFNQAEVIAKKLGSALGIDCENLLIRTRNTHTQVGLSREQRLKNLKEAFQLNPKHDSLSSSSRFLHNKVLIIIDDVMTTGSTFEECAKPFGNMKANGLKGLYALAYTRG